MTIIVNGHQLVISSAELAVGLGLDFIWLTLLFTYWKRRKDRRNHDQTSL